MYTASLQVTRQAIPKLQAYVCTIQVAECFPFSACYQVGKAAHNNLKVRRNDLGKKQLDLDSICPAMHVAHQGYLASCHEKN